MYWKISIITKDEESYPYRSDCYPLFEGGFIRIITKGTFMEAEELIYLRTDSIEKIELIKENL